VGGTDTFLEQTHPPRVEFKRALALQEPDPTRGMLRLGSRPNNRAALRARTVFLRCGQLTEPERALKMGEEVAAENGLAPPSREPERSRAYVDHGGDRDF